MPLLPAPDVYHEHSSQIEFLSEMGGTDDVLRYCKEEGIDILSCPNCGPSPTNGFRCLLCDRFIPARIKRMLPHTVQVGRHHVLKEKPHSERIYAFPAPYRGAAQGMTMDDLTPDEAWLLQAGECCGTAMMLAARDLILCRRATMAMLGDPNEFAARRESGAFWAVIEKNWAVLPGPLLILDPKVKARER